MSSIEKNETYPEERRWRLDALKAPLREDTRKDEIPDLFSASRLWHRWTEGQYVLYLIDFQIRNPVMWYLFYRWWFFFSLPSEFRNCLPLAMRAKRRCLIGRYIPFPYWTIFARHHPVLFLLWLVFYGILFQFFVKALTAPVKAIKALWAKAAAPSEIVVLTDFNDELVIEGGEVPTSDRVVEG